MQQTIYAYTVNSLKSIFVLNLAMGVFAIYIFYQKTYCFLVPILLPHLFRQQFSLIYLQNVYHKAPHISLHSLTISPLKN